MRNVHASHRLGTYVRDFGDLRKLLRGIPR
jgi:hypothetical protein